MASYVQRVWSDRRRTLAVTASLLAWVPALIFLKDNTYQIAHVRGVSMTPSFNMPSTDSTGGSSSSNDSPSSSSSSAIVGASSSSPIFRDTVLMSMIRPGIGLRRGDVVAFWTPQDPDKMAVKRVVALENDEVQTRPPYPFRRELVPPGHVWVEGDNPEGRFSRDSNEYGPISCSLVAGRVVARLWPNPMRIHPHQWEASDLRLKDGRIRKNVGSAPRPEIYS